MENGPYALCRIAIRDMWQTELKRNRKIKSVGGARGGTRGPRHGAHPWSQGFSGGSGWGGLPQGGPQPPSPMSHSALPRGPLAGPGHTSARQARQHGQEKRPRCPAWLDEAHRVSAL
eukprot:4232041-Prymnesium_polylepis.1